ncbi:SDR family NAD(P)-dependent oxidoreductase [Rhodoferax sp. WC2427]|uniref:SDR family NAD(P)-dependent oxidoreductase n=1 Tax=Rhodoferax sp. WC2427 TaxID=3234144 RepID=UPI0034655988
MDKSMNGRVAIVTGAGAGIGFETTRQFLAEGVRVVAADLDISALNAQPNDSLHAVKLDMREAAAAEMLTHEALQRFGQIDILFNNAGVATARDGFLKISDDDWQATFNLNLMGYVRMSRAVLPHMLERKRGALIHCASETGRIPHPLLPDYSVSKAAILMLSKILATEFTGQGVRSNVVSPAHVRTALWDRPGGFLDSLAAKYGSGREEAVEIFLKTANIPSGRLGRPEDVAAAVLFLASDQADFITGVELAINGGVTKFV